MKKTLTILYTTDVHGRLTAYDYSKNLHEITGLTRLKTWLLTLQHPYLLLDNGDLLQGSPMLDYHRIKMENKLNPAALVINDLKYDAVTLGNHDFNYGLSYLDHYVKNIKCPVVCCNILDDQKQSIYLPYIIFDHQDIKIGLIGAITSNVPNWEQADHIKGLHFEDAYLSIKNIVETIRNTVDLVVVLYHGGIEKDLKTKELMGVQGIENQGYKISTIPGVDVLLTGHQHLPIVANLDDGPLVMQTLDQASMIGAVTITMEKENSLWKTVSRQGELLDLKMDEDLNLLNQLQPYHEKTLSWLSKPIGKTKIKMKIEDSFQARYEKNPMFEWVNRLQMALSGAMISISSLPNQAPGFSENITLNDLSANFIFPNIVVTLEISGKTLKAALERNAMYFTLHENKIVVNPSYLYPKLEHYNYDLYDGIDYTIDVKQPFGERIVSLFYGGSAVKDDDCFSIVMNNYRATGGGQYPMYAKSKVIATYDMSMFDLAKKALTHQPIIDFKPTSNIHIIF